MAATVRIRGQVWDRLLAEARRSSAVECCGLLAGAGEVITEVLPARNALASPTAFAIAPEELFELFRRMRAAGWVLRGIYHSHLRGENVPSPRDIEQAFYPEVAYFVLSPQPQCPRPVRAFRIVGGRVEELAIERVE